MPNPWCDDPLLTRCGGGGGCCAAGACANAGAAPSARVASKVRFRHSLDERRMRRLLQNAQETAVSSSERRERVRYLTVLSARESHARLLRDASPCPF